MRLYIAGPMTGLPEFNYPAFYAAAHQLDVAGYEPINPARDHGRESCTTWLDYMRASLRDVADADGIATLPGWQDSRGAALEVHIARSLDLPVRPVEQWLTENQERLMPQRIQRKRTRGWRMPEGAVYVGRSSRWGNPWRAGSTGWTVKAAGWIDREPHPPLTAEQAVESFRNHIEWQMRDDDFAGTMRAALAGHDLACWCPLDSPCHADVLLEIANQEEK